MNPRRRVAVALLRLGMPRTYAYLHASRQTQWLAESELKAYQLSRVRAVLTAALAIPTYADKFSAAKVVPSELNSLEDLGSIPTTNREELTVFLNSPAGSVLRHQRMQWLETTGSTGYPFRFPLDSDATAERLAIRFRTNQWFGHWLGDKNIRIWRDRSDKGILNKLKENVFGGRIELPAFNADDPNSSVIDEAVLDYYYRTLRKERPVALDGYPSVLRMLSAYILDKGFPAPQVGTVVTGGETLQEEAREKIEQAFQCPVLNRYGGTEIGLMAHECGQDPDHRLHWMADRAFAEVLVGDRPANPGELGRVVVTDFTSRALPFIRYELDDVAVAASPGDRCACGRTLPLVRAIEGRVDDLFRLPGGGVLSTHVWHKLFREAASVRQFQIVQEDIWHVKVTIVPNDADYTIAEIMQLRRKVENFLPGIEVEWQEVGKIPIGPGGKFRYTYSEVAPPFAGYP